MYAICRYAVDFLARLSIKLNVFIYTKYNMILYDSAKILMILLLLIYHIKIISKVNIGISYYIRVVFVNRYLKNLGILVYSFIIYLYCNNNSII